ncbi:MAG: sodium:proton antiporter [Zetaproteobacteria bacterium CG_4_9_14_3_um_filter_49_83]|nr:MAG: sodium:proton antiporter [Zetaproteobacteria bacterium CG1_02_49_23]PIQ34512.1 MAG: sodium:proton antiporter [Zetaproteobacteria bacterium CG17_big_fil_post_rev_8_21_14_2_50_50_13]PIV30030.1 MAG: sodium:proton antiporter [Zetaproteobacteria bacterium CG02_land_8_20_14_3_00_50_9]PIY55334.1 MAG: sodium:proton antiporter [Zetaproteobacteria bacterium CG_4_10_14_0_8_um_filter_49_80]PJA34501.1 MAG: sodium:proton antiporter [Zetaproteobacteria bacterium CG_4_9_14_3_um_filter_49_83]
MELFASPTAVFIIAVLVAVSSHLLAERISMPPIVLWLIGGIILGPYALHILHAELIEPALHTLIELALAIILFEGGLNLNLKALRAHGMIVTRLLILGPFVTMLVGGISAHALTDLNWPTALLFGAIVSVGGPTVIIPIVRQVRLDREIKHILTSEAMLVDAIGAILAIVMLQLVLTPNIGTLDTLRSIVEKLGVGTAVGFAGGWLLSRALLKNISNSSEMRTVFTLACVWGIFLLADMITEQAGLMAVLVAGAITQRMELPDIQRLRNFKASLSILLISVLFVLLASQLDLALLNRYLWQGIVIFILLALIARPWATWLSCMRTKLNHNQIIFLSAMAPRGVVAAAITSLFALVLSSSGHPGADILVALVYIIIILSVLTYGFIAAPLSRHLKVDAGSDRTVLIIGGGQMGAEIGRSLCGDREVRFLDMNGEVVSHLHRAGFRAVRGNALDPLYMEMIHAEEVSAVLVMTGSSDHNLLIASLAKDQFHIPEVFVALQEGDEEKHANMIHRLQARRLFGKPYTATYWADQASRKRLVYDVQKITPESGLIGSKLKDARIPHGVQPLCITRADKTLIPHDDSILQDGDEITVLLRPERVQAQSVIIPPPASGKPA